MSRRAATLVVVTVIVLIAGIAQLAIGPGSTGLTLDETTQAMRADAWVHGGDFVPDLFTGSSDSAGGRYVYGPAFALVAHTFNVVAGHEPWGAVRLGEGPMVTRHLVSALFALLTAILAGAAAAFATRSRAIGLWTAAALLAIPLWTGMGFFNPKDTPVAAGYTFFTAALVFALRPGRTGWKPGRWDWLVLGTAAGGVFFAAGTRLAMWLPLLLSAALFAVLALQAARAGQAPLRWPALIAGSLLGLACLIVAYPAVFSDPLDLVARSLGDSSEYPWHGVTLTAGRLLPEHPSWWYLPAWAFASIPLLIGFAALCGAAGAARGLWRTVRARTLAGEPLGRREGAALLVLAQLLILPAGSMLMGSTMYSGLRQHLYVLPAVAMLAGIGASYLLGWARSGPVRGWLVTGGLAVALIAPMTEQLVLFPYNYVYVNPVAGLKGVDDRWEGDYWWASLREASDEVPDGEVAYCADADPNAPFDPKALRPCSNLARPYAAQAEQEDPGVPGNRWTLLRRRGGAPLPPSCAPEGNVTRRLRGETIVISYVARC